MTMLYDDDYESADPLKLSKTNYALWWLGSLLHSHMLKVRLNPEEIRYLHRDRTENDTVILKELLHGFQRDMGDSERKYLRECLTLLLRARR